MQDAVKLPIQVGQKLDDDLVLDLIRPLLVERGAHVGPNHFYCAGQRAMFSIPGRFFQIYVRDLTPD